jgi:hypothetical protein
MRIQNQIDPLLFRYLRCKAQTHTGVDQDFDLVIDEHRIGKRVSALILALDKIDTIHDFDVFHSDPFCSLSSPYKMEFSTKKSRKI